mmetsp:Transcript_56233/g.64189  ORF Transcript_56233/g.64189 Transcript_56233/m.64189 type:complete len:235 (+) Transcript_56233:547-1251(+)
MSFVGGEGELVTLLLGDSGGILSQFLSTLFKRPFEQVQNTLLVLLGLKIVIVMLLTNFILALKFLEGSAIKRETIVIKFGVRQMSNSGGSGIVSVPKIGHFGSMLLVEFDVGQESFLLFGDIGVQMERLLDVELIPGVQMLLQLFIGVVRSISVRSGLRNFVISQTGTISEQFGNSGQGVLSEEMSLRVGSRGHFGIHGEFGIMEGEFFVSIHEVIGDFLRNPLRHSPGHVVHV